MRFPRTLVLGVLATLLAGLVVSAAQTSVTRRPDDSPLTVPVGRVGDEAVYATFYRDGGYALREAPAPGAPKAAPPGPWEYGGARTFKLEALDRTADRTGLLHDVLVVRSNGTEADAGTVAEFVDLGPRLTIRRDARPAEDGAASDGVFASFFALDPELPGLAYQGATLRLGGPVPEGPPGAPVAAAPSWTARVKGSVLSVDAPAPPPPGAAHGYEARSWVAERALVGGRDSYAVRTRVQVDVPADLDGSPEAEEDDVATLVAGGRVVYERAVWLSAAVPYPVLTELRAHFEGPRGSGSFLDLQQALERFDAGDGELIPWGRDVGAVHYRAGNDDAERSAEGDGPPADGARPLLPYALSQAVADAEGSLTLLAFQQWRQANPGHRLVSAELTLGERHQASAPSHQWRLVFAVPSGRGYEVTAERTAGAALPLAQDRGEKGVPPFSTADLPARPVTLAAAARLWSLVATRPYQDEAPNYAHWGFRLDQRSGPLCLLGSSSTEQDGAVADLGRVVVGYSTRTACGDPAAEQSLLSVGADTGNLESLDEWRSDFDYRGAALLGSVERPEARPKTVTAGLQPPTVERTAVVSTSLLALFLAAYFLPLLKFAAAKGLLLLPGYSKLAKSDLLKNRVRDDLLALIKEAPGIHASDLGRRVDAGWGTVVYHLGVLERNKLISSLVDGRHKRFFPVGAVDWSRRGQLSVLMNERTKALFAVIQEEPGIVTGELATRLGLSVPTAMWHLRRLEEVGLVGRDKQGRAVHYFPVPGPSAAAPTAAEAVEVA